MAVEDIKLTLPELRTGEGVSGDMVGPLLAGIAEGEVRSRKQTLKMLLHERFRKVSPEVLATIDQTSNPTQLDEWLRNVLRAKTVRDVGIAKRPRS